MLFANELNFNWSRFPEQAYKDYASQVNAGHKDPTKAFDDGDFIGAVYVGDLCFDFTVRFTQDEPIERILDFDMYVGGVDTGYGYSDRVVKNYPYDWEGGSDFGYYEDTPLLPTFHDYAMFRAIAEQAMTDFINNKGLHVFFGNWRYDGEWKGDETGTEAPNISEKAKAPTHVW